MSSVCRVCLAGKAMYSLKNNQLLYVVHETLSNNKCNSEDAALCDNCYQKLLRCHAFTLMAHRSEQILTNVYHKDPEEITIAQCLNLLNLFYHK